MPPICFARRCTLELGPVFPTRELRPSLTGVHGSEGKQGNVAGSLDRSAQHPLVPGTRPRPTACLDASAAGKIPTQ